ncbi:MAG: sortase [Rubrobacter sp.]|nr:sortase [Rubrobacter sp.]
MKEVRIGKLLLVVAILAVSGALSACSSEQAQEPVAPKAPSQQQSQDGGPSDKTLTVTVPKMQRVKDAPMPDSSGDDEEVLKNYAGVHLEGTGFPWQQEANVYLAGHRLGYPGYPSFLAFYDLDKVESGDQIFIKDADGKQYTYEVFKTFEVDPTDLYVTEPVNGKNIVTLQSCTLPDYAKRVIVQAELKNS